MKTYLAFIAVEIKMFYRDRAALFWTLAFPTALMLIFGFLNFDRYDPPEVGIVDNARNQASAQLISILRGDEQRPAVLNIPSSQDPAELSTDLSEGDIDAVMTIPEGFGTSGQTSTSILELAFDSRQPQQAFAAESIIEGALEETFRSVVNVPEQYQLDQWASISMTATEAEGQGYQGFIVSGIVALSIMQSAMFGVVFTFVRLRSQGVLRRFKATPINPSHFLTAMIATRLITITVQSYILLLIGTVVLGVTIGPDRPTVWLELLVLVIFAAAVFVTLGLAVSSIANSENSAAPIANVITLPMMFLSGVFFPQSVIPDWLVSIAQFFPLTFLADGMRAMVNSGESIFAQGGELLGLFVWAIIIFALAIRVFRWE